MISLADFQPLSIAKINIFSAATEVLQSDMPSVKVHASEEVTIC